MNRYLDLWFQHTAARRRLVERNQTVFTHELFQHTAARRRLGRDRKIDGSKTKVSTHSRPKAAGVHQQTHQQPSASFNTQPPEGGWFHFLQKIHYCPSFNTQPPEGGWPSSLPRLNGISMFQHTAARRRLGCFVLSW